MRKILIALMLCLVAAVPSTIAQTDAKVMVFKVLVNGEKIDPKGEIVIGTSDKIEFDYRLETKSPKEQPPFRFMVSLRNSAAEKHDALASNVPSVKYENLSESSYTLEIQAFDPTNSLNVTPAYVNFRVSNHEVKLLKQIADMRKNAKDSGGTGISMIIAAVVIGVMIIGFVVVILMSNKKQKKILPEISMLRDNIDTFAKENDLLHKEVVALRTQITQLNQKAADLVTHNKDLSVQTGKLDNMSNELDRLHKRKDDIFNIIVHEIKNPVGMIKSLAQLLNSYDLSATEQKEIVGDILDTAGQIMTLSRDVSKVLLLESDKISVKYAKTDISEVVSSVCERNSRSADKKSITIFKSFQPDMPSVECDPAMLDEIIENLMTNAIKYSPEGSKVLVEISKKDKNVEIAVKDNGPGLSQEDIDKAFQRGTKLSAQATANEVSTGFGLWIVKKLTEAHHGKVRISSLLGTGSIFMISLPITQGRYYEEDNK